ncbi:MAG: protein translocase subunit SecF [Propionibacteriaceae bacterium]|jgi:preprotein translocase subunit SecF|nr:protein translocase subunit SecF [Propionibacteriaceae bacterium]
MSDIETPAPVAAKPKKVSFAHRLWTGEISYDFVGHARWWYLLSGALIIISIVSLAVRGLDLGIEFRGGSDFQVNVAVTGSTVADFRDAVIGSGVDNLDGSVVSTVGTNRVVIETRPLDAGEQITVREAIAELAGVTSEQVDYNQIGASWGQQVLQQAGIALVVFLVLVSLLMGIYFRDMKKAISALIALIHDMTITVGLYALVGFTVTPATLTGLLTILGYSLYDTVVVFDKIRENTANLDDYRETYAEAANRSVNMVLVRSINTTVIGVLPVAAILFAGAFILGSGPLEDIGLALFVGMIIAAYSSIFLATPILAHMRMAEPGMKLQAERVAHRREKLARVVETPEKLEDATYTVETTTDDGSAEFVRQQPQKLSRAKRGG